MRNKLILLFIFILSFQAQGACIPLLNRLLKKPGPFAYTDEYKYRQKIGDLENFTNFLRRKKENPEPALNLKIQKKIALMNEHILNGAHAPNERRWRTFFREFEANFISYKRSSELVDLIRENPDNPPSQFFLRLQQYNYPPSYIDFMRRRLSEVETLDQLRLTLDLEKKNTLVQLGNNYQEYRMIRENLNSLYNNSTCNEQCKKMITMLQEGIGADSHQEKLMHELFFEGSTTPDIQAMRELLYQQPLFVLTKLKKERNAELFRFLYSFISQTEVFDKLLGLIYKSKLLGKTRAMKLFKLVFNAQARKHHLSKIDKVILTSNDAKKSLESLQHLNTSFTDDELLVSFARRTDSLAQSKWRQLKELAKASDTNFLKRMKEAEAKGEARGALSPTQAPGALKKLAVLLTLGTSTVGYFYFNAQPTALEDINSTDQGIEVDPNLPVPDEGAIIPFDGEENTALDEAVQVIIANESTRSPSSEKSTPHAFFTQWWCGLFSCQY